MSVPPTCRSKVVKLTIIWNGIHRFMVVMQRHAHGRTVQEDGECLSPVVEGSH
jgi:hypothetical protein